MHSPQSNGDSSWAVHVPVAGVLQGSFRALGTEQGNSICKSPVRFDAENWQKEQVAKAGNVALL